jgi:hypothetical protein
MISFKQKGNFLDVKKDLKRMLNAIQRINLDKYGEAGVKALASATPIDTGNTANSWYYKIERKNDSVTIGFYNSNIQNEVPIAVILQYGHGTRNGGWVQGRDYINPAIRPVFDNIVNAAWREVSK